MHSVRNFFGVYSELIRSSRPMTAAVCLALGLVLTANAGQAVAQDSEGTTRTAAQKVSETITVSARKRDESLQDVPVAIQAFNNEQLELYQATDLQEISQLASQVILIPAASGAGASFHIRGIGSSAGDPGVDSSVVINIDGVQVNRGRIIRQAMFDVGTVEILKGPQALFFGKNSPAGVVSIKSQGPTDEWEFLGRFGYETEAREFIWEAIASGPINDKFGIRLAYRGTDSDGWLKNVAQPIASPFGQDGNPFASEPFAFPGALDSRKGGNTQHIGRLTLQADPTDNFSATLKVLGTHYTDDGAATLENTSCSGDLPLTSPVASGITAFDPFGDCDLDGVTSQGALPPEIVAGYAGTERRNGDAYGIYDSVLVTLDLEYSNDNFVLSSITGYFYYDWTRWDNFDGTVFTQYMGIQLEKHRQWSQELRFLTTFDSPVNFMLGAFYENVDRDSDNRGKIAAPGPDPINGFTNNWEGISTVKGDSWSVFAQLIWDITENLELAGGLRYTEEDKTARQELLFANPIIGFIFFPVGVPINSVFKDDDVSPEATLTWAISDEVTVYGAYKTGYKSGGFSTNTVLSPTATSENLTFDAESSKGFEFGVKSSLLGGALRINATVYRYTFSNLQVSAFDQETTSFQIRNAASARTTGVEIDLNWVVNDNLILRGQVGYNEARYSDFAGAPCYRGQDPASGCVGGVQDLTGSQLVFAPDWSGSVGFTYDRPIGNGWLIGLSSDAVFQGGYFTALPNDPRARQGNNVKVNASLRLYSDDDRWELAVIGRNIGNKRTLGGSADKPGGLAGDIFANSQRARQIIFQVTARY